MFVEGLAKLGRVRPGRGRKPQIPAEKIDEIVRLTQESKPEGETHWSCRSMAKAVGVSPATVQRVWSARGLKPHLVRTFTLSNDHRFDEELIDVVGVYLNPPDRAVVLCVDENATDLASHESAADHGRNPACLRLVSSSASRAPICPAPSYAAPACPMPTSPMPT